MNTDQDKALPKFRRLAEGEEVDDLQVILHVTGGPPSERLDERFVLSGAGVVEARVRSEPDIPSQLVSMELDRNVSRDLIRRVIIDFEKIGSEHDPRQSAVPIDWYEPDALIGILTIQGDGERVLRYFPLNEDALQATGAAPPALEELTRCLREYVEPKLRKGATDADT